jgi:SNARE domain
LGQLFLFHCIPFELFLFQFLSSLCINNGFQVQYKSTSKSIFTTVTTVRLTVRLKTTKTYPTMNGVQAAPFPLSGKVSSNSTPSHAVSRSSELVSCARTALKIAKSQHPIPTPEDWWYLDPSQLSLYVDDRNQNHIAPTSKVAELSEDGIILLRAMQSSLEVLQSLVKRRGHVNDPTQEISTCTQQLEEDSKELSTIVQQIKSFRSTHSKQHQRHVESIANWLETTASQQSLILKDILKVRGAVLATQAQRRKLWNPQSSTNVSTNRVNSTSMPSTKSVQDSPLFTVTPMASKRKNNTDNEKKSSLQQSHEDTSSATYGRNSYYAPSAGYGGYYGSSSNLTGGIRQRRVGTGGNTDGEIQKDVSNVVRLQEQVRKREEKRQTQNRLVQAKQAESSLVELSTLFTKMSNLIVAQGETIEKIEDDVEAAQNDVKAGQAEIQILYELKKGNRALILKTFAVIIFIILFMRLY